MSNSLISQSVKLENETTVKQKLLPEEVINVPPSAVHAAEPVVTRSKRLTKATTLVVTLSNSLAWRQPDVVQVPTDES